MLTLTEPNVTAVKAKFFRGFSDPTRLTILKTLRAGSCTVSKIIETTGLAQSNVSNHLACLKGCGLVTAQRQGRNVHYRLSDPRIDAILGLSEDLLAEVAQGVYECTRDPGGA